MKTKILSSQFRCWWKLILLSGLTVTAVATRIADAQTPFFREDFKGPESVLTATGHLGSRLVENGNYIVTPKVDERLFGSVTLDSPLVDFSLKTQVRTVNRPTGTGYFILIGRDTDDDLFNLLFGAISTKGDLLVGDVRQSETDTPAQIVVDQTVRTDFNPVSEDVFLQVDFVGHVVSVYAWPENESKPQLPQVLMRNTRRQSGDLISLEYNPPPDLTPGIFRFFEVSPVEGDFDSNAVVDALDVDLLTSQWDAAEVDLGFDLNVDGAVNHLDLQHWVKQVVVTRFGDANLDGAVTVDDFQILSQHMGQRGGWAMGDFDGNGVIEFPDFLLLSDNYRKPVSLATVAEPTTSSTLSIACLSLFAFDRRRRRSALPKMSYTSND